MEGLSLELKKGDLDQLVNLAAEMAHEKLMRDLFPAFGRLSIPKIGEVWPGQGGHNGGLMRGINGGRDYFLIVSDKEHEFEAAFGSYGTSIETSDVDGVANTKLMAESALDFPAAKKCAAVKIDGHNDYHLMSRRESRMLASNVPELFDFSCWYQTSTQYSATSAYVQAFGGGSQGYGAKDGERRVRPVRRLFI